MIDGKNMSAEQLGRVLHKRDRKEPRKNQKRYLKDIGGDGTADELDQVLEYAELNREALAEAKRLERQRELTIETVDAGIDSAVIEMIGALRLRMEELGITQTELAERCDWAQPQVAAYLTGKKMPGLENLTKMARAMGSCWRLQEM